MKLTALAVVLLALGIAVALPTVALSKEKATMELVAEAIAQFNQDVIKPIADAVAQLQGDVTDLDQRVTALESGGAPQQREDQIPFPAGRIETTIGSWNFSKFFPDVMVALDPADYPPSAVFRLEGVWYSPGQAIKCLRLFDLTTFSALEQTETCYTSAEPLTYTLVLVRLRSDSIALPSGEHEYALQAMCEQLPPEGGCGNERKIKSARIIAEWTE